MSFFPEGIDLSSIALRLRAPALLLAVALVAAGCGEKTAAESVAAAKTYLQKNDTKAAIVELKAALQRSPQDGEARFLLGEALLKSGNAAGAVVELEKAQELRFDDNRLAPALAQALLLQRQAKKVTDQFTRTQLGDRAAGSQLKAFVAAAFGAQGDFERAQAFVEQSLALDPKNVAARLLQARLTAGRGDMDGALAGVDAVLADDANHREAWQLKGEILWVGKRDPDAGAAAFAKVLELEPKYLPAHSALISLALTRRDTPAFKARVDALRQVLPNHPETRFFEAQEALLAGDAKRAREIAQLLLRASPDSGRLLQLAGAIELQGGSLTVAETHLVKALQFDPRLVVARRLLAQVYSRNGQPARAIATLQPLVAERRPDAETLAALAEAHLQNGQFAESEALFRRAAELKPDDAKIQTALALGRIARGDVDNGLAALDALAGRDSGTYADLALISSLLRRDDADAALRAIDRLQKKQPQAALPHLLRGRLLARRDDIGGARASFEQALAADADYFPAAAALAAIDIDANRPEAALKRFEDQLARDPKNYRALLAVAELRQRSGEPPAKVRTLLQDAVKAQPSELAPRLLLIDFLLSQNENDAARSAAQDAASALAESPPLLDALGRAQLAAGDVQQALSAFGKIATAQPQSSVAQLRLAQAHLKNRDVDAVRRSLARALEIDPRHLQAQAATIELALREKRYGDALATARTVQQQRPKEAVGFLMEADVHLQQRQLAAGIAALRTALDHERATPIAMRLHATLTTAGRTAEAETLAATWLREQPKDAQFVFHLGVTAMDAKDHARAQKRFEEYLALRTDDPAALNNLAWVKLQQGRRDALADAEHANRLAPNTAAFMDTLASALAANGQLTQAIEWQRRAVEKSKSLPAYRLRLAKLLLQSGDKVSARTELQALAALGPRFAQQAEVSALLKEAT